MRDDGAILRVGMIDGPVDLPGIPIANTRNFSDTAAISKDSPALQHGNGVANRLWDACPGMELYVARVFGESLACRPQQVAEAIYWLMEQRVAVINMSFGLRHDRQVLRRCCREALECGTCLVAATPAQGQGVYPSLYPGVVRATGDARCSPGEISSLASEQADFGGYPGSPDNRFAGASAGCASVSGAIAQLATEHPDAGVNQLLAALAAGAAYRGPERRRVVPMPSPAEGRSP
jgi:hypothetical protein